MYLAIAMPAAALLTIADQISDLVEPILERRAIRRRQRARR
jgi:hypothetical protein